MAAGALILLALAIRRHWAELATWRPTPGALAIVVINALVYGGALFLLAEAWHRLLVGMTKMSLDRRDTLPSLTSTQIGKYLPGNVLHYVGRHAWLSSKGVPHKVLALAALWETAVLAGSSILFASASLLIIEASVFGDFPSALSLVLKLGPAAILAAGGAIIAARALSPQFRSWSPPVRTLVVVTILYLLFMALLGGLLAGVGFALGGQFIPLTIGAATLSWFVGFLTPGAPGGLGTRELVLVTLLGPQVGGPQALLMTGIFRVVTVSGDLVCFAASQLFFGRSRQQR